MLQKTNPQPHSEMKPKPVTHGFNYKEKKNKTAATNFKNYYSREIFLGKFLSIQIYFGI